MPRPSPMTTASSTGHAGDGRRFTQQARLRLADDKVRLPAGGLDERGHHGTSTGHEPSRHREDGVAIRDREEGSLAQGVGGHGEALVGEVEVDAHGHGIRPLGQSLQRAGDGRQPGVTELAGQARTPEDERQLGWARQVGQRQGGAAGRGQDALRAGRSAHAQEPFVVFRAVPARVIGDIDDDVAGGLAPGEQLRHAGHRLRAAVDDTIQVDEKEHASMVATRSLFG